MHSVLRALVELQEIEIALRRVQAQRNQGPERLSALEEAFRASEADVGAAKHRYEQLTLERVAGELELKSLEQKLAKFQSQLMEVRTSKEYSAVLKEIDAIKSEISRREDELLVKLEEMSALSKDVPDAEARIAAERERYESTRCALDQELADVAARLEEHESRKLKIEQAIPSEVVENFNRIAKARGGLAVVRVKEPICPACNVRIRVQVFAEIRRGESLVTCDSCRRFLYYLEPAGVALKAPSESPDAATQTGS